MIIPALQWIFWLCMGAIAYNYAGYPALLYALGRLMGNSSAKEKSSGSARNEEFLPRVAILISALNEELVIEERVKNLQSIKYPPQLLEILIGLDAPVDTTPEILKRMASERVQVFHFANRRGKLGVISDLSQRTSAEILVFTDANTHFEPDCVANLIRHFADCRVGAVSGEELRTTPGGADPAAEGLYWKYECALKVLESRVHCLHSANGGVYAIRRELFQPQPGMIVEDFQIPLALRFAGHWIVYDPAAIAVEEIAPSFQSQFERRIRLGAGNFQTLLGHPEYLNPFRGRPAFAYWSHRVLRWITPLLLLIALVVSAALSFEKFYLGCFLAQLAFYLLAGLGFLMKRSGKSPGVLKLPLYFCSMNLAMLFGMVRFLRGRQSVAWAATPRGTGGQTLPMTK